MVAAEPGVPLPGAKVPPLATVVLPAEPVPVNVPPDTVTVPAIVPLLVVVPAELTRLPETEPLLTKMPALLTSPFQAAPPALVIVPVFAFTLPFHVPLL
jgi:hypothetical protein